MTHRIGGHAVVDQLLAHGTDLAFCVPGESYLAVLDGLHDARDRLRLITARQEGGAALMAAAYGKITGRPGVCLVTRGPGATNASIGVHVAHQDASPMILLVGQVPTRHLGRRAFQEVDYPQMFGSLAKDVIQVTEADRVPELIARAFHTAVSGEPGPVVVALPEDVLAAETDAPVVAPAPPVRAAPAEAEVAVFVAEVTGAERPLIVVGGSGWTAEAGDRVRRFAERAGVPVASAVRHQDLIDNRSPAYAGTLGLNTTPGLAAAAKDADLIAFLGTRPDGLTVGDFALLEVPQPSQRIVHIHPDPAVFHHVYRADLAITSSPSEFAASLPLGAEETGATGPAPAADSAGSGAAGDRAGWVTRLRENHLRGLDTPVNTGTDPVPYMKALNARLPADAIITAGAGNYTGWPQRHHQFTAYPSQLAPQAGAMGYGLPAAIAAKLAAPDRTVVAFAGDGCLLMTGQELATAARYGLDLLVIVINNSRYGTIRDHQETRYPGRVSGTDLVNPDFVTYARSFGAASTRARTVTEFESALDEHADKGLTLIEVVTD